mgnify:CR=1 FL=1
MLLLFVSLVNWLIGYLHAINLLSRVKIKKALLPKCFIKTYIFGSKAVSSTSLLHKRPFTLRPPDCSGFAFIIMFFPLFLNKLGCLRQRLLSSPLERGAGVCCRKLTPLYPLFLEGNHKRLTLLYTKSTFMYITGNIKCIENQVNNTISTG